MALADTLSGSITVNANVALERTSGTAGNVTGRDLLSHKIIKQITDGSSTNNASGFFAATVTVTTAAVTLSLADSADPMSTIGDDVPSSDPEGLKLRFLMVENTDATNFVTLKSTASTGETSIFSGTTDKVNITAGGFFAWSSPAGNVAMNDGADDEFDIQADTASCICKITYVYG